MFLSIKFKYNTIIKCSEGGKMRKLRSSMIVEISYHEDKNVTIKRFPTKLEIEELDFFSF